MKKLLLLIVSLIVTSCYTYKQAEKGFKIFEKNDNYKIVHNNTEKEIKVLEINKDSIKIKYYSYNNDMQTKKSIETISIKDIESVKISKPSTVKSIGVFLVGTATLGIIYYTCCFNLNWK